MIELIEKLSNTYGISGDEGEIRSIIEKEMKGHTETSIDRMGNLTCHHKGKSPTVVIAAHMDEVGLMVREVDDFGHIYFSLIGSIEEEVLLAQRVTIEIGKKQIRGVITCESLHEGMNLPNTKFPSIRDMYVDAGLSKNELKHAGVSVGTYMTLDRHFVHLGSEDVISGKAFDDRIGCAILVELSRRLKGCDTDIYFIFTLILTFQ